MFSPLYEQEIEQIVTLQIGAIQKMLKENGIAFEVEGKAVQYAVI